MGYKPNTSCSKSIVHLVTTYTYTLSMWIFIHITTTPFYIMHFTFKGLIYAHLKGQTFSEASATCPPDTTTVNCSIYNKNYRN